MNLNVTEIKAFIPSKDFETSKRFYQDLGFRIASDGDGVAYFHMGHASFLLQDFCAESSVENCLMHLLVQDVDAWWSQVETAGLAKKYGVKVTAIQLQRWRMRDFCLTDPTGVVWRIGQNVE